MTDVENDRWFWTCMAVFLFMGMIVVVVGYANNEYGQSAIRQQAIDHNCAEWRIDAKTGEREFVWLGKGLPTEGESDGN